MKKSILLFVSIVGALFAQGSREGDSLALVAIQEANPGSWLAWDYSKPLEDWVYLTIKDGRVDSLAFSRIRSRRMVSSLQTLPAEIGNLTSLTTLDLAGNSFTTLPAELGNLTKLTTLDLSNNSFSTFPVEIENISSLTSLDLAGNSLQYLPPEIGNLTNLIWLGLNDNALTTLPPEIGNLSNLAGLEIESNSLITLPSQIGNLTNLNILLIDNNSFTTLPSELWNLRNLTGLGLSNNFLTTIPSKIENLTNLNYLYLENTSITSLPTEIGNLINLIDLDISNNSLISLPEEISELKPSKLNVSYNYINESETSQSIITWLDKYDSNWRDYQREIPNLSVKVNLLKIKDANPTITELNWNVLRDLTTWDGVTFSNNLTGLNLSGKRISTIPVSIEELTNLNSLDFSNNKITQLPKEISRLSKLLSLNLSSNNISNLPKEITALTPTSNFDVSNNALVEELLSESIITWLDTYDPDWRDTQKVITNRKVKFHLLKIKDANPNVNLNWDLYTDITTWEGVTYDDFLKDITELNLSGKGIKTVPTSISNLTRLAVLKLSDNRIDTLPKSLGNFEYLRDIDISNNRIIVLPEGIIGLNPVNGLNVGTNGLKEIYMKDDMIAWLDKYDPDWRSTQGQVAIAETNPTAPKSFSITMGINNLNFSTPLSSGSKLSIFTLNGKEIVNKQVSGISADIPPLAKGMYLVRISSEKINSVFKMSVR